MVARWATWCLCLLSTLLIADATQAVLSSGSLVAMHRTCTALDTCTQCGEVAFCDWCPEQHRCSLASLASCQPLPRNSCSSSIASAKKLSHAESSSRQVEPKETVRVTRSRQQERMEEEERERARQRRQQREKKEQALQGSTHGLTMQSSAPAASSKAPQSEHGEHVEHRSVSLSEASASEEASALSRSDISNILSNTASALSDASLSISEISTLQSSLQSQFEGSSQLASGGEVLHRDWLTQLEQRVEALEKKLLPPQRSVAAAPPQSESSFQHWRDDPRGPFGSLASARVDSQAETSESVAPFHASESAYRVLHQAVSEASSASELSLGSV